ncbi:MAG: signal peptidase II [Enterobacteriaceae bacterium]
MSQRLRNTGLFWLWLALLVIAIDLSSKQWVMAHFWLGESVSVLPFFSFTYAHNTGAAFSLLADSSGWQRWFFAAVAALVTGVLLVMMYRGQRQQKLSNCAYALIIGGALGNLFDRMVHGVVIDFLHFHLGDWSFPVFNLADTAICIGAGLILLEGIIFPASKKTDT